MKSLKPSQAIYVSMVTMHKHYVFRNSIRHYFLQDFSICAAPAYQVVETFFGAMTDHSVKLNSVMIHLLINSVLQGLNS